MLGLCLVVIPASATGNNHSNAGVVSAATEVINGVTYEVVNLTSNDSNNRSLINARTTGNYRYVLTANWQLGGGTSIKGNAVIFDLNGYTLTVNPNGDNSANFSATTATFELTDTSMTGAGKIIGNGQPGLVLQDNGSGQSKAIISGGTLTRDIHTRTSGSQPYPIFFRGGNFISGHVYAFVGKNTVSVPPYYKTNTVNNSVYTVSTYDYYAVSTAPEVLGIYNYEFSLGWDLNGTALGKLALPTDQTYYLWARDKDGQYRYIKVKSVDGAWQSVL